MSAVFGFIGSFLLGTCESIFFVRIESAVRFVFESNIRIELAVYHASCNTAYNGLQAIGILYLWRTRVMCGLWNSELSTCLFQFSHKTRQTMLLYAYFTPKVDFKRKFNHHQSFLYEWRLTALTIQKFWIGPSIRIESWIGRRIRNRIESRSFAGPYFLYVLLCFIPFQTHS